MKPHHNDGHGAQGERQLQPFLARALRPRLCSRGARAERQPDSERPVIPCKLAVPVAAQRRSAAFSALPATAMCR